jgi:hypothetical protein
VKKIKPDGSKTLYVGGIYEVDKTSGGTVTQTKTYYPAAGAMRIGSTLYYVLKDHLGSASVVMDANGTTVIGEDRFREASLVGLSLQRNALHDSGDEDRLLLHRLAQNNWLGIYDYNTGICLSRREDS